MFPQRDWIWTGKTKLVSFVWHLCSVRFQMCTQRAWTIRRKVTSVTFVWLFNEFVFNCFFKELGSEQATPTSLHLFLWFSNVSLKSLDLKRQSHIGCICLNFSTVRFKLCPQISCPNRCKFTSVAFVWLFYTVRFQMFPQRAWISQVG